MADSGAIGGVLQPPRDDADVRRFLTEVENHQDFLEVQQRLERLAFDCPEEQLMAWSVLRHRKGGRWTVDRRQLHSRIGMSALGKGSAAEPGKLPLGVLLIGAPGSGKTSVGAPIAADFGVQFVVVNSDDYKEQFPEYRGWNAAALHAESAYVRRCKRKPAMTYERLKTHKAVISWQSWSTDVTQGQPPILLEKGLR